MTDRTGIRYQLPSVSYIYAAVVLGFSVGLVYFDTKGRSSLPNVSRASGVSGVNLQSIPDLPWDPPVPLRVVTGHLSDREFTATREDATLVPLNLPPHRCRCSDCYKNRACSYMNVTSATHSKVVVERWSQALSRCNITVSVKAT